MSAGNSNFERTDIGSNRDVKKSSNTSFNFLKANVRKISGGISTITKDYNNDYYD